MKYSFIIVVLISCIFSNDAPPPNFVQRCVDILQRSLRVSQVGYFLDPELKDCLNTIKFDNFYVVKDVNDPDFPQCSDYKSITFQFPPEGEQEAIVEVNCTENCLNQRINVRNRTFGGKTVFGEMMFAMLYLDEHEFKYAIFETLDHGCAWIGWRDGVEHPVIVPDEIRKFLKVNKIAYLDHGEASSSRS